jgi:hypothetical protein
VLVEAAVRVGKLTHVRLSVLRVDVKRAHLVFGLPTKVQQVRKSQLARVEESICELPRACALRQLPPKYTTVQSRSAL